jgi:response regulator NasT
MAQRAILVVEPDEAHRAELREALAKNGSRVVGEAGDPDEAMRLAAMTVPDVALLAVDLGGGHGIPLAGRLATEHGIPAILLAPSAEPTAIAQAAQGGMMGFLVKPVNPATLHATLELAVCRFQDLMALRRESEALRRTLEARKVIERAKGLLMELKGLSEQEAFARIRQKSMDTQRPMAEIARAIILAAEVSGGGH